MGKIYIVHSLLVLIVSECVPFVSCLDTNCTQIASFHAAKDCCRTHGKRLPNLKNLTEVEAVISEIVKRGLESIWLDFTRTVGIQWFWIHGARYKDEQSFKSKSNCAYFSSKEKGISSAPCKNQTYGYICEQRGCSSCGTHVNSHHCIHHEGKCYLIFCDTNNWQNARSRCLRERTDLAVLDTPDIRQVIQINSSECTAVWIGLSKEMWTTEGDSESKMSGLWADNEPSDRGNCALYRKTGNEYLMYTTDCFKENYALCFGETKRMDDRVSPKLSQNLESTAFSDLQAPVFRQNSYKLILPIAFATVLAIVLTVIGVCLIIKRKKIRRIRRDQEAAQPLLRVSRGLRTKIANTILNRYRKVKMWSWTDDSLAVPIDKIYVDLCVEKRHPYQSTLRPLSSYDEIFQDGNNSRIYLYGEAGAGKTTLTQRMACDWSNTVIETTLNTKALHPSIAKYKYVLPLFLRNVKEGTLCEVLRKQFYLSEEESGEFYKIILDHSCDILFVCDGYDEFLDDTCPDIARLVKGDIFPDANILVTSRGQTSLLIEEGTMLPDCIVQLKGFTDQGVQMYIHSFFREIENSKVTSLLQEIENSNYLKELSHYPALILLMCVFWRETKALASNATQFFKDFIAYTCRRFERKYETLRDATPKKNILDKFSEELLKIGEIAVNGLKQENMHLVFGLHDVKERIGDKAWKLGFFQQNEEDSLTVSFYHKLLQEYFAALYITKCNEKERTELLIHFYTLKNPLKESIMFTKFITGLGRKDIVRQIAAVMRTGDEQSPRILTDLHLQYIVECPDVTFSLPSHVEISTGKSSEETISRYLSLDGKGLSTIQLDIDKMEGLSVLRNAPAESLEVLEVTITGRTEIPRGPLGNILSRFKKLHTLRCKTSTMLESIVEETVTVNYNTVFTGLASLTELRVLDLTGTYLGTEASSTVASALKQMLLIEQLILKNCRIDGDTEMLEIIEQVEHLKHLAVLNLSNNTAGNASLGKLTSILGSTDTLVKLFLWNQENTDPAVVSVLIENLSTNHQLESLDIQGVVCPLDSIGDISKLFYSLVWFNSLHVSGFKVKAINQGEETSFSMKDARVGSRELEWLSKQIPYFKKVNQMSVSKCISSESSGWVFLIKKLNALTNLHSISFEDTNVDSDGMRHLQVVLTGLPICRLSIVACQTKSCLMLDPVLKGFPRYEHLSALNLSKNILTDSNIRMLTNALPKVCRLATLHLAECNLTDKPITRFFIRSLGKCRSLQTLILGGNRLAESISVISVEMHKMCNLQSMCLSNCALKSLQNAEVLLEALRNCPTLKSLDLSENFIGDRAIVLYNLENQARKMGIGARVHLYRKQRIQEELF